MGKQPGELEGNGEQGQALEWLGYNVVLEGNVCALKFCKITCFGSQNQEWLGNFGEAVVNGQVGRKELGLAEKENC